MIMNKGVPSNKDYKQGVLDACNRVYFLSQTTSGDDKLTKILKEVRTDLLGEHNKTPVTVDFFTGAITILIERNGKKVVTSVLDEIRHHLGEAERLFMTLPDVHDGDG
jgi:hypothetical protein